MRMRLPNIESREVRDKRYVFFICEWLCLDCTYKMHTRDNKERFTSHREVVRKRNDIWQLICWWMIDHVANRERISRSLSYKTSERSIEIGDHHTHFDPSH
ncbi:unnamed protein product [Albugo candida]|uniref:Uncharacterized protein n=1 Tax=Albugo candida TaxID=65357 RepID=A0A024FXI6_9STRA|nr:unnamed protein product [Albugo candida]|eukprot:CCI39278.1 unnamed protein product [Albugo candida]